MGGVTLFSVLSDKFPLLAFHLIKVLYFGVPCIGSPAFPKAFFFNLFMHRASIELASAHVYESLFNILESCELNYLNFLGKSTFSNLLS